MGTLPRGLEKVSVSVVRLSSRTFSLGTAGGAGVTGLGNVVVVGGPLLGRKIKLKPVPANSPVKFARTPSGGDEVTAKSGLDFGSSLSSISWILKSEGIVIAAGKVVEGVVVPVVASAPFKVFCSTPLLISWIWMWTLTLWFLRSAGSDAIVEDVLVVSMAKISHSELTNVGRVGVNNEDDAELWMWLILLTTSSSLGQPL